MKPNSRNDPVFKPAADSLLASKAQAKFSEGKRLHQNGQLAQAQQIYQEVLKIQPQNSDALFLLGAISYQTKNLTQAVELISKAIEINPNNATAHSNLGVVLNNLKQHQAAVDSYDKAIALRSDYADAYSNRGNALNDLKQYQAAVDSYDKAIALKPDLAEAHYNRGNALNDLKQYQAAVDSYDKAISLKPDFAKVHYNRGNALNDLKQHQAAVDSYDKAIVLRPDYAEAYYNRGNALNAIKQYQAAVASYGKAIALKPDYVKAYHSRGTALYALQQHQAAIDSYDKALAIGSEVDFLYGERFHTKMEISDWSDTEDQIAELIQRVQRNEKASQPLSVLAFCTSLPLQRKAAEIYVKEKHPSNPALGQIPKRTRRGKIRLGYFSMDFRNHAVAFLTAGLFETHDRERFEVFAFSFGFEAKDEMRTRLEAAFDKFIDVKDKSDKEIAELARQMQIDIAIDLAGFTGDSRTGVFALRAAQLQVNYLGYPGTMGADYIDYLIADRQLVPEEAIARYAEKIVYLPSFQANDRQRKIADKAYTREEFGLPQTGFVFCCFNKNCKIAPSTFDGWMRILKRVNDSVLFLYAENELAATNLQKEATHRGVDANRLIFGKKLDRPDYLARYRTADLFLDTLPFNAGTTASDALWTGLPVLTCTGDAFASRMAASLLTAIGLPELITTTQVDYEALAIELATHPERLKAIKQKLERNRLTTPLFDTKLFTKHIEDAYTQMVERYHADLAPDHIYVGKRSA